MNVICFVCTMRHNLTIAKNWFEENSLSNLYTTSQFSYVSHLHWYTKPNVELIQWKNMSV